MNFPRTPRTALVRMYDTWFCFWHVGKMIGAWVFFTLSPWQFDGGEGDEA